MRWIVAGTIRTFVFWPVATAYSLNDTANALGISLAAAKGRLFHARGMLRRAIRMKEGNEEKQLVVY
jgi:hypothetical protein